MCVCVCVCVSDCVCVGDRKRYIALVCVYVRVCVIKKESKRARLSECGLCESACMCVFVCVRESEKVILNAFGLCERHCDGNSVYMFSLSLGYNHCYSFFILLLSIFFLFIF